VVSSGQNQIFPLRGYIAETYAKVSDGEQLPITAKPQARVYPLVLFMDTGGWVFSPPIGSTISRRYAAAFFLAAVSPRES
jgi:hypothetical protein